MPFTRKRSKTLESPVRIINNDHSQPDEAQKISAYEQSRDQRIRENMERMQKLGIVDLSHQLKSTVSAAARKRALRTQSDLKPPHRSTPMPPSVPTRRSSRLQNATPVSYTEVPLSKKNMSLEDEELLLEKGSRPEVYTEEHEKLLGSTERTWTLFVDGYGSDGKRIYDPFKGKTCHQCRQKTLGLRTECSQCNMVQGQFCGDCLYMRYGEHVVEANENPNWVCPVCRGICNCSLCRQAKGWPPTGALYRKISKLGFKSCAHYLIQTRRGKVNLEGSEDTINQVSAKRSLPFSDIEAAASTQSLGINEKISESVKPESEDKVYDHQINGERGNEVHNSLDPTSDGQLSAKRSLPFSNREALLKNIEVSDADNEQSSLLEPQSHGPRDDTFKIEKENETQSYPNPCTNQLSTEAGHGITKSSDASLVLSEHEADDKRDENQVDRDYSGKFELQSEDKADEQVKDKEAEEPDSADVELVDAKIALDCSPKLKRKKAPVVEPNQDSIARRLKQRRLARGNNHGDELSKCLDIGTSLKTNPTIISAVQDSIGGKED